MEGGALWENLGHIGEESRSLWQGRDPRRENNLMLRYSLLRLLNTPNHKPMKCIFAAQHVLNLRGHQPLRATHLLIGVSCISSRAHHQDHPINASPHAM